MRSPIFTYPVLIKESYLDTFGHVNNAMYLSLLEEARWDLITKNGFGLEEMRKSGLGAVVLDIKLRFIKEILLREEIIITTQLVSYEKKIGIIAHTMMRGNELCCSAELTIGLWDLKERKLMMPTPEWLHAIGCEDTQSH